MKKLRIVQVINSLLSGGAEKLVVETSLKFIEAGHKVDILLLKTYDSPLSNQLEGNSDIDVYSLGADTNMYSPLCIGKIKKHLKAQQYDVVHAHLFPPFYWVALAKGASKKSIFIHTEHNTDNRRMSSSYLKWLERFMYKKYDCHIAISNTVRTNMERHILNKDIDIKTIFNGVNLSTITEAMPYAKSEFGLQENDKLILQVSAFRPQKNQQTVIRALETMPDVHLLLVGDGEKRQECEALTIDLNVNDRVHFLGIRSDVPRLLKTADIVVLSSHYEGLSLSSVEGMASGKPFVASDVPGLTEVVEGAGMLFEDNDHNQLADSIKTLFNDKELYTHTAKNCMQRSKDYDLNAMVAGYLTLYQETIAAK